MARQSLTNPQFFTHHPLRDHWLCNICPAIQHALPLSLALRHEDTSTHTYHVRMRDRIENFDVPFTAGDRHPLPDECSNVQSHEDPSVQMVADVDPWLASEEPLQSATMQTKAAPSSSVSQAVHGPALTDDSSDQIYDNWAGVLAFNRPVEEPEGEVDEAEMRAMMAGLLGELGHQERRGDVEPPSPAEAAALEAEGPQYGLHGMEATAAKDIIEEGPHYMSVHVGNQDDFWPWPDKAHSTLDMLGGFPRSMFSETELEAVRWFGHENGLPTLPSVKAIKRGRTEVVDNAGSNPRMFTSSRGNVFTMADLVTIIRHEFANPLVARNLHTLPEKSGEVLGECFQAQRWGSEVDPELAGPMVRAPDGKDYYVNEMAMVVAHEGQGLAPVMIRRWFREADRVWATVSPLLFGEGKTQWVIDERPGREVNVPLLSFRLCVEDLLDPTVQTRRHIPSPREVAGVLIDNDKLLTSWVHPARNRWRMRAGGSRVVTCPLWLYCDDTSGNTSKKWNKHNSLLFTFAGLPRSHVHLMYNIHYLATSNLASPLEMMEPLVDQLCAARESGIEAWDANTQETVLVIPWVLAFLGDNPMSSEFASHIGMQGKCFCRRCKVKGADSKSRPSGQSGEKERVREFLSSGEDRTKESTLRDLHSQLQRVLSGAPSAVDEMATETGTKDKYFAHYVAKLQNALAEVRERHRKSAPAGITKKDDIRQTLQEVREAMPPNIFNPVLRIPDFDANQDTPFEALHVVLLGAVKYFWRDAVSRQTSEGKEILITRLNSLDTTGLGIPEMRGQTLVNFAGSLVGRDFRAILQVAPAVLHGLVPEPAYEAWLALTRLAPLIFQPVIHDLTAYTIRLQHSIEDFLAATALWSTQWFNKPKFHLFLHLPYYILRFGPAILYATEGFESYNFLIRLRSIHSNRHAPSMDIGESFSFLHAVRHLVSGGYVGVENLTTHQTERRQAGEGVRAMVNNRAFRHLMGMEGIFDMQETDRPPMLLRNAELAFTESRAAQMGFNGYADVSLRVLRCVGLYLANGDLARPSGWVLYHMRDSENVHCGRVEEILLRRDNGAPLGVLILRGTVGRDVQHPYRLPSIRVVSEDYSFVPAGHVLATVHTFHNCATHRCPLRRTKVVWQERQQVSERALQISHVEPEDLILNLAQLTNASLLSRFRSPYRYPTHPFDQLIEEAVQNRARLDAEVAQKKKDQQEKRASRQSRKRRREVSPLGGESCPAQTSGEQQHVSDASSTKRVRTS